MICKVNHIYQHHFNSVKKQNVYHQLLIKRRDTTAGWLASCDITIGDTKPECHQVLWEEARISEVDYGNLILVGGRPTNLFKVSLSHVFFCQTYMSDKFNLSDNLVRQTKVCAGDVYHNPYMKIIQEAN